MLLWKMHHIASQWIKREVAALGAIVVIVVIHQVVYAPHPMILPIEVEMTKVVEREYFIVLQETERKQKAWSSQERENLGLIS